MKVRIFERAETLGLVAIMSKAFERFEIIDNPRAPCTYASVLFQKALPDEKRKPIAQALNSCTVYEPSAIFLKVSELKAFDALKACEAHRRSMLKYQFEVDTLYLSCLRILANHLDKDTTVGRERIQTELEEILRLLYGQPSRKKDLSLSMTDHITDMFLCQYDNMLNDHKTRELFLTVMTSGWMMINI